MDFSLQVFNESDGGFQSHLALQHGEQVEDQPFALFNAHIHEGAVLGLLMYDPNKCPRENLQAVVGKLHGLLHQNMHAHLHTCVIGEMGLDEGAGQGEPPQGFHLSRDVMTPTTERYSLQDSAGASGAAGAEGQPAQPARDAVIVDIFNLPDGTQSVTLAIFDARLQTEQIAAGLFNWLVSVLKDRLRPEQASVQVLSGTLLGAAVIGGHGDGEGHAHGGEQG